jgi:hypothetical protein
VSPIDVSANQEPTATEVAITAPRTHHRSPGTRLASWLSVTPPTTIQAAPKPIDVK